MNQRSRAGREDSGPGAEAEIDVWIVGAGPAGLALAHACAGQGLRLGLLDPDPERAWAPNYGLWLDDAEALEVDAWIARRWSAARLDFAEGPVVLDRGYGLLDDRRWQLDMLADLRAAAARVEAGALAAIEHDDEGVCLHTEAGAKLRAKLVVDATGHDSAFVAREDGPPPAYQVAWGERWAVDDAAQLAAPEQMGFMDWRSTGSEEHGEALPPSFLYAMPAPEAGELFVEETVLVGRAPSNPGEWFSPLERRLRRRLDGLGLGDRLRGAEPLELERCVIPMGGPLPRGDQRTLAFGGAAAMVHPATGYMLSHALRRRERVAKALAELCARWVAPGLPSREAWRAIWTDEEVRAWRLFRFGMEVTLELDRAGVARFFREFFELPEPRWRGFLSASSPTPELMATMLRYFAAAPWSIQRRLAGALFGREGLRLAGGFAGLQR